MKSSCCSWPWKSHGFKFIKQFLVDLWNRHFYKSCWMHWKTSHSQFNKQIAVNQNYLRMKQKNNTLLELEWVWLILVKTQVRERYKLWLEVVLGASNKPYNQSNRENRAPLKRKMILHCLWSKAISSIFFWFFRTSLPNNKGYLTISLVSRF